MDQITRMTLDLRNVVYLFLSSTASMTLFQQQIDRPLQRHGGRLEHNETYCGSCYGAEEVCSYFLVLEISVRLWYNLWYPLCKFNLIFLFTFIHPIFLFVLDFTTNTDSYLIKLFLTSLCQKSVSHKYQLWIPVFLTSTNSEFLSTLQSDDHCCNTCEDVREAYRKKGWALTNPDEIDQVSWRLIIEGFTCFVCFLLHQIIPWNWSHFSSMKAQPPWLLLRDLGN